MKFEDFMEIYENLRKKYALPSFEEINERINIKEDIKKLRCCTENEILKFIVKRYYEQFKKFKSILEDVLNPDLGDLAIMHEVKGLEFDYNRLWEVYKKVAKISRMKKLLDVEFDMNMASKAILEMHGTFNEAKNAIKDILTKKIEFWERDIKYKGFKEYIG